jgi:peptidoglycan/LPS O-acetylase OafA/YrhL
MTISTKVDAPRKNWLRPIWNCLFPPLPTAAVTSFNIPELDGIRAISILLVVLGHCGLPNIVPGGLGVTIFFFLSGFLITTLMRREVAKMGTVDLKSFYIRRCLRILPPCYIVSLAALAIAVAVGEKMIPSAVLANLAYLTNYRLIYWDYMGMIPGLDILWSLAVEEHFYLIFPLAYLAILGLSQQKQGGILAAVCLAVLAWRCVLVFGYNAPEWRTYVATDTRLDSILWGCLLAIAANPALGDRWGTRLANWGLGTIAMAMIVGTLLFRAGWFRETFRYTIQGVALMPLFALAIRRGRSGPLSFLHNYMMRLISVYSYTIYLVHSVLLVFLFDTRQPRFIKSFPVVMVLSFISAALMYRFVDVPMAAIRRRYSH